MYNTIYISQYEKENHPNLSRICSNGICSKGPKNEFKTAVENEPSVFEPLKFYCIFIYISPPVISNYFYLKVLFLGISTLSHRELTVLMLRKARQTR